ncbi:MAG: glycosyltransferase family 2 protein [Flavicella sp.]
MKNSKRIAVVVPIYNEEQTIDILFKRLFDTLVKLSDSFEIIFVNDGSRDGSQEKITQLAARHDFVKYINFTRNFGHQIAVTAGLEHCDAACTVIIDGDLQDPPELIEELYREYEKGYEVVYAKRNKREGETFLKKITSKLFYRLLKKITSIEIPLDTGDFRLIDKKVVVELKKMQETHKFIRGQIAWMGFSQKAVLFDRPERIHGNTGYSYSKMIQLALDGITGFSDKPLAFVSRMGLIISMVSFCVILFSLFSHFVLNQTVNGWTSLIIVSSFLGGIQLLSVGIIGEYISRIHNNTKQRKIYIVKDSNVS